MGDHKDDIAQDQADSEGRQDKGIEGNVLPLQRFEDCQMTDEGGESADDECGKHNEQGMHIAGKREYQGGEGTGGYVFSMGEIR